MSKVICAMKDDDCPSSCAHSKQHEPIFQREEIGDSGKNEITCTGPGLCFSRCKTVHCIEPEQEAPMSEQEYRELKPVFGCIIAGINIAAETMNISPQIILEGLKDYVGSKLVEKSTTNQNANPAATDG